VSLDEDVAEVRRAVAALEQAAVSLSRHHSDTVDLRRLQVDVGRLAGDVDLLCGAAPMSAVAPPPAPAPHVLEVIDDTAYAHDFWMDAEDEGLGLSGRKHP